MVKTIPAARTCASRSHTHTDLGLSDEEFGAIQSVLGREPNDAELCIYSAMWSEHASYKNSVKWLKTLPSEGPQIVAGAGAENAGAVDVGDGYVCVFKIESHNHPCAVEPVQGAATGVGGITRDIFTMGARPVAQLNSLRFGDLKHPSTKKIVRGVVKGIGNYGNCIGIPMVGGEAFFDESYNDNPLVNVMSVGVMRKEDMVSAVASGVGNPVFIVGSETGRDGIHGASFASEELGKTGSAKLSAVQQGDPFKGKLLIEACLELAGSKAAVGMQDMGAAGIICSTSEMSAKGGCGMKIDLKKVPLRAGESDMEPWEILLSESQERMLVVGKKGQDKKIKAIFEKWNLLCVKIGEVVKEDRLQFYMGKTPVADVPASSLVLGFGAPVYDRKYKEHKNFAKCKRFDIHTVKDVDLEEAVEVAKHLCAHPDIASKRWIYEQFDSMVGARTMTAGMPSDAGVVALEDTGRALALTVDGNARYIAANPLAGAQIAVAEAARNIVCAGGRPLAVTDCLNFGNPTNPESYWQFVGAVKGTGAACLKFQTPVTGGNVSFYNAGAPVPVVGMLGILERDKLTGLGFRKPGDSVYLLGKPREDISSSLYLYSYRKVKYSPAPHIDLDEEYNIQRNILDVIEAHLVNSAHDISDGGLMTALLESAMVNDLGFDIMLDDAFRIDSYLFGESQGRVIVSIDPNVDIEFEELMMQTRTPMVYLGSVTSGKIKVDDYDFGNIKEYKRIYETALASGLE